MCAKPGYCCDMKPIDVDQSEWELLLQYKRQSQMILVQAKSEAILLASRGIDLKTIADFVERQPSTVEEWLTCWRNKRLSSIFTGHQGNDNASKLTPEQKTEMLKVLAGPPSNHGLLDQFWSPPALANWLEAEFGVTYESPSSYHFWLHLAGLSFHKPDKLDQRRADDQQIDARMTEIRAQTAPLLADPDWLVYAADEVGIDQEAITRRAWLKQVARTIVKVDRARKAQSFIGNLDQHSGHCELHRLAWQNTTTIIESLKRLVADHPGKQICVVWDNAAWYKTKDLRQLLAVDQPLADVLLIAMPPYAPDHNPIEHVWKDAKDNIANIQRHDFTQTVEAFEAHIASRTFHYKL